MIDNILKLIDKSLKVRDVGGVRSNDCIFKIYTHGTTINFGPVIIDNEYMLKFSIWKKSLKNGNKNLWINAKWIENNKQIYDESDNFLRYLEKHYDMPRMSHTSVGGGIGQWVVDGSVVFSHILKCNSEIVLSIGG